MICTADENGGGAWDCHGGAYGIPCAECRGLQIEATATDDDPTAEVLRAEWRRDQRAEVLGLASGPHETLGAAQDAAYNLVDPPHTLWAVVEIFGPEYDRPAADGSGETWGQLWAVPHDAVEIFAAAKGAESFQTVDAYGYDLGVCSWWLLCDNPATMLRPHPVLGDVPICDRCNAKVEGLEQETRR